MGLLVAVATCYVMVAGRLEAQTSKPRPAIRALQIAEPIVLDGRLTEPAWARAEIGSDFSQREPEDGLPASERTEFFVLYTTSTLYFGIIAHDSNAKGIIAKEMERDSRVDNDDSIAIVLDTFHDRRNAYSFEFNPNGARLDLLITDEGDDLNPQWNGVWAVSARRNAAGWVAEVAIPFSTLRYNRSLDTWGLQVRRGIRRKNEEVNWAALGREIVSDRFGNVHAAYRVSLAGTLTGLEGLRSSRQLDIKPFFVGTATDEPAVGADVDYGEDAGLDVKWGITKSLVLDLTYNTDFAEVEVDNQQVNLTRFSLFFPEKREFFLENAGIFDFGPPQRDNFEPTLTKIFFSRRIGLDQGQEVPIDLGGRVTGRVGGWNVGVMSVLTEGVSERGVPETTWNVLRLKKNIGRRSSFGAIYTDRSERGAGRNQVLGFDFDYKPTNKLSFSFFESKSDDPGVDEEAFALGTGFAFQGRDLSVSYDYQEVQSGFRPGMGFLLRDNFVRHNPRITYLPRINRWGIQGWYFGVAVDEFQRSSDGALESRKIEIWPVGFRSVRYDVWRGSLSRETERLFVPFEIRPGIVIPAGLYEFDGWTVDGRSNRSRSLSLSGQLAGGDFFDGDHFTSFLTLDVRASRFLKASTGWGYNDVQLPSGDFETNLFSQSFDITFSTDMRLNTLVQYSDADDEIGLNLRFSWEYKPGSDLYIVYNHNWDAMSIGSRETRVQQLIVKFTYLFQL